MSFDSDRREADHADHHNVLLHASRLLCEYIVLFFMPHFCFEFTKRVSLFSGDLYSRGDRDKNLRGKLYTQNIVYLI